MFVRVNAESVDQQGEFHGRRRRIEVDQRESEFGMFVRQHATEPPHGGLGNVGRVTLFELIDCPA